VGHDFLSDEWFAEVRKLTEGQEAPEGASDLTLNITVTGGPSGDKQVHMAGGEFGEGHADGAPTTLTVPYEVAKKTFIEGDQQAAMQAFMSGQIKVEGDMSKLMAMQTQQPSAEQQELQKKIAEFTN
jgi:putative sterol carrier protein